MIKKWIYKLRYILIILTAVLGLLGLSSSFGDFNTIGYYYYSDTNTSATAFGNTYFVSEKGSFNTNHVNVVNNVFYWNFGYDNLVKTVLAWKDGKLYFIGGAYDDIKTQGYIEKFCIKEKSTRTDSLHADNCVYDTSLETIIQGNPEFTEYAFMVNGSNTPTWGYGNTPLEFCFSDGNLDYCVSCSAYYQNTTNEGTGPCASGLTGSLNITGSSFDTLLNYVWSSSAFSSNGGGGGGSDSAPGGGGGTAWGGLSEEGITNDMVINNFEQMGWNRAICFNGIVSGSNSNLLSGVAGKGSNIFQVYADNNPLGFDNIYTWYDYYRQGFSEYRNIGPNSVFWWDGAFHMGIYNIFAYGSRYGVSNLFPAYDIIEYCDLIINRDFDSSFGSDQYTGDLEDWERQLIYNAYYNNAYYYYTGDFNLDLTGAIDSLSGGDFSGDFLDMLGDLSRRFNNGFGQLGGNVVGIIPSYITAFLFALILIRILRK